jgi:hypothetical protein
VLRGDQVSVCEEERALEMDMVMVTLKMVRRVNGDVMYVLP